MKTTEKPASSTPELESLEELHQKLKDEAEAWQTLLENMYRLKNRRDRRDQSQKP